jgi:hypothetical protein
VKSVLLFAAGHGNSSADEFPFFVQIPPVSAEISKTHAMRETQRTIDHHPRSILIVIIIVDLPSPMRLA